ncbi:MAG TPA: tetratricopeptide repeat protein [Kofleriaceae bacterium]
MGGSRPLAALLASALLTGPALADPRPPSEKDRQLASDLVKKAIARSQAGDHLAAIEIYNQAYTIIANALLLSNIGAEFQQAGMPKEALKYFCMYLDKDPSGTNAPYATSQAKILQRQLGNKKVDERDVCAAPRPDKDDRREGDRRDGDRRDKDDKDDPGNPEDVRPRPRTTGRGSKESPSRPPVQPDVVERDTGNPGLMYVGVTAGLAGLAAAGAGIYFGLKGKSISDDINSHRMGDPWPDNIQEMMHEGDRDNRYAIGALVTSGVLVTAGIVLYVISRPDGTSERTSEKTAIHVTPTAGGFAVFGRF